GLLCALLLTGCGQFFPGSNTIVSLAVSPTSAQIKPSAQQQFSATATYGNNSTGDVSSSVTWTSSNTGVATISTSGLATAGTTMSTTNITAKSGSVISNVAVLTVSTKTITTITVNPQNFTLSVGGSGEQYTATATYSDGTNGNVTLSVTWSSSDTAVATITSAGFASPVATGSTTISASLDGIVG